MWRFLKVKTARANRFPSDADNDELVFQVRSEEKKLFERKGPSASSSCDAGERTN
jgi:hypothetical protein